MKAFIASVLLVASVIGLSSAVGAAGSQGRPPGVAAADWVSINDSLGIVILRHEMVPAADRPGAWDGTYTPGADGYFMVKDKTGWRRLVVIEPFAGRFQPT